jgi:hypothetical protein
VARATAGGLDAVVTELDDETGQSIAQTIVVLAAKCPKLPIVIYDKVNGATLKKLLAVFAVGLRIEFAARPYERLAPLLRRILRPTFRPPVTPVLLQRFVPSAPADLRVFVALAALAAPARRGVEEVAARAGPSTRTIERRLRRAQWPTARVVLQSFRALDAIWLMSEYGWSARRVQHERGYTYQSSVTRLLSRYAATRPLTLREDGGFAAALEHVARVLSARPAP